MIDYEKEYFELVEERRKEKLMMSTPERRTEQMTIEADLNTLGTTLARLCSKSVDRRIISDTMVNSCEKRDILEFCSNFDNFLRELNI